MRTRRLLLAASALSTLAFGCSKPTRDDDTTQPLPGNPKGAIYDAGMVAPDRDAEPIHMPANPKGTFYDAAMPPPRPLDATVARDAAARPRDASPPPRDATTLRPPPDGASLVANPKGSFYDDGLERKQ